MAALIGINVKKDPESGGYSCKVPIELLAEDGVPPAEGDTVSYQVDGTVKSVSGDSADITIEAINGQPVSDAAASAAPPSDNAGAAPPAPDSSAAMRPGLAQAAKGGSLGMF
jgi:hypothetical protein